MGPGLPLMAGNGRVGEDEDEQQKQGEHEVGRDGGGGRGGAGIDENVTNTHFSSLTGGPN